MFLVPIEGGAGEGLEESRRSRPKRHFEDQLSIFEYELLEPISQQLAYMAIRPGFLGFGGLLLKLKPNVVPLVVS